MKGMPLGLHCDFALLSTYALLRVLVLFAPFRCWWRSGRWIEDHTFTCRMQSVFVGRTRGPMADLLVFEQICARVLFLYHFGNCVLL